MSAQKVEPPPWSAGVLQGPASRCRTASRWKAQRTSPPPAAREDQVGAAVRAGALDEAVAVLLSPEQHQAFAHQLDRLDWPAVALGHPPAPPAASSEGQGPPVEVPCMIWVMRSFCSWVSMIIFFFFFFFFFGGGGGGGGGGEKKERGASIRIKNGIDVQRGRCVSVLPIRPRIARLASGRPRRGR